MADRILDSSWVDRYVLNALSEEEATEFEAALFDSEALRRDVEAALSLQSILSIDETSNAEAQSVTARIPHRVQSWQPLALAASLLVGVVGIAMWFTSSSEVTNLRGQISKLNQASSEIVIKRIDVTRSSSAASGTPVLKPAGDALLVLDVELSSRTKGLDRVQVGLVDETGITLSSWSGDTTNRDRVSLGIRSGQLRGGSLSIEFRQSDGELLEERPITIITSP